MNDFIAHYEYPVAWTIYVVSGIGCCIVWWRITSRIPHGGWRDLCRGFVVVLIFTPWYAGESPELYAPALVVLLMDLLLEGAKAGMKGGLALLISSFLVLLGLTVRLLFFKKQE